jgi:hypothetical protein
MPLIKAMIESGHMTDVRCPLAKQMKAFCKSVFPKV